MLPGARQLFEDGGGGYVQDHLIAWYDGIYNVGIGRHSDNTLVWRNLGSLGSVYDAMRMAQATAWTDNGAVFHHGSTEWVFEIPGYLMRDEMGSEWSYELVFTPDEKWIQGTGYCGIFGNHGSDKGIVGGQTDGDNSHVSFTLFSPAVQIWQPVISEYFSLGQIASVSESASNASHSSTVWKDGQIVNSLNDVDVKLTFNREGTYIGSAYFGRDPEQGWRVFDGTIHCVRVYNKPLTEAEVKQNYAVDVERFNLNYGLGA